MNKALNDLKQLEQILANEKLAIENKDWQQLHSLSNEKQQQMRHIEQAAPHLKLGQNEQQLLTSLHKQNELNGRLIQHRLRVNGRLLQLLNGQDQGASNSPTYDRRGYQNSETSSSRHIAV